ncbi:MAG: hypothetical protein ABIR70_09015 [Bryobacteraceae bacterium]
MSDRLYLSCWTRDYSDFTMLRYFSKFLATFPISKLSERPQTLRVHAVSYSEPAVFEKPFEPTTTFEEMLEAARDFTGGDCAIDIETAWDLWQFDGDWKLAPAPVVISCFGQDFEQDSDDHLRIDFGLDAKFLPSATKGAVRMQQSNIRSLLYLVSQVEGALPLSRRKLWSESGANFAEILAKAVRDLDVQ